MHIEISPQVSPPPPQPEMVKSRPDLSQMLSSILHLLPSYSYLVWDYVRLTVTLYILQYLFAIAFGVTVM